MTEFSELKYLNGLSAMKIVARTAELQLDGVNLRLAMTPVMFSRLQSVAPEATIAGVDGTAVLVVVPMAKIDELMASNVKAHRVAPDLEISSRTVYGFVHKNEVKNTMTYAEFDSTTKRGYVVINGIDFPITTGRAADYYGDAVSEPERDVYLVAYRTPDGGEDHLVSYGVTNVLRRIASMRDEMLPLE